MAFLGADSFRGELFFAICFRQKMFFCAKNIFSLHLAIMATGSANPEVCINFATIKILHLAISSHITGLYSHDTILLTNLSVPGTG